MRAYKLFASVAAIALVAGCADGKDGADGATGAKGDKGDKGEPGDPGTDGIDGTDGTDGTNGENGEDAACAAFEQLAISRVVGVDKPVFPGAPVEFELVTSGGSEDVSVQFIGTMSMLDGSAALPALPAAGTAPGSFTVTPAAEGDVNYVAIATDGCTVATTTFTIKVRSALVTFVHLDPSLARIGFALRGDTNPLYMLVGTIFGPIPVATIGPGNGFPGYFRLAQTDLDVDMFPDADGDGAPDLDATPNRLPKIALTPDARVIVASYANAAGVLTWAVMKPDQSIVAGDINARVQFAHLAGGFGPIDVATDVGMTTQIIQNAELGTLGFGLPLAPLDYNVFIDTDEDGTPNYEASLPLEAGQVLPGDYVVVMAWQDAAGALKIFVHDTGGDDTEFAGGIFPFPGEVFPYLGPADVTGTSATPTEVVGSADIEIDLAAADDCAVKHLIVKYDVTTLGATYGNDLRFSLTSPGGTMKAIGSGKNNRAGAEVGKLDASAAFAYELADGTWTVTVTDTYGNGATVNSVQLDLYCGEPLGDPDKVVTTNPEPDLEIPDDSTMSVTSTATVTGPCTVNLVKVDWAVTHDYSPDLDFALKSPSGADFVFLGSPASTSDLSGSYGPLDAFKGDTGAGVWTLEVADMAGGDAGTLDEWTLSIYCE